MRVLDAPIEIDETGLLQLLRAHGATGLERVRFKRNRRRIWSVTRHGRALNLHEAYRGAPRALLVDFVHVLAGPNAPPYAAARRRLVSWPGLAEGLAAARGRPRPERPGPCCATPAQRRYLESLYGLLNRERFGARLPSVPLRLSSRMRSRLGQMVPARRGAARRVIEIALNADLMLAANDALRVDTLLHEMAHVADHLFDAGVGHGPSWREWARAVGCEPRATVRGRLVRRRRGAPPSRRVPA